MEQGDVVTTAAICYSRLVSAVNLSELSVDRCSVSARILKLRCTGALTKREIEDANCMDFFISAWSQSFDVVADPHIFNHRVGNSRN